MRPMTSQQQGGGRLMPPNPVQHQHQQTASVVNLTVLQRMDPYVEEILTIVTHVSFYKFDIDLHQWCRKDVEGSLFVVKRNTQPRFQFIVMNRRNTDNLVEDLLGDFEFDVQVPYILYRNASQEVNGIWFYNEQDCEAVANLFNRILTAYSKVSPKSNMSSAKSAFGELEVVPTVMEGPLELLTSSAPPVTYIPDDSYVNSFNEIMSIGNRSSSVISGQQHQSYATTAISPLMHSVIPSPLPPQQPIPSLPTPSAPLTLLDSIESRSSNTRATDLVKPSLFTPLPSSTLMRPPIPSSIPTAPPLHPPVTMQRPYGTPLLQPFPPPTPPLSLTPAQSFVPVIARDKVQDALLRLVQNDHFIDMVYREMMNS